MPTPVQERWSWSTFEYSAAFRDSIVELHRGKENLPAYREYIAAHLGGLGSRLSKFARYLYPEIRYRCGDLKTKRVLDFGCGTGASTAVLAMHSHAVVAFDIDDKSGRVCQRRLDEHGLSDRVSIVVAPSLEEIIGRLGQFDLVLLNAVIEHIPLSLKGQRRRLLTTLFDALDPGGHLYINETPNRLWPIDHHTTGLWWIPWSRAGSRSAYERAVRSRRHLDNPSTHSDGPLGLEERGAWGATFFEIRQYLAGRSYRVMNTCPGFDRHLSYVRSRESRKLRVLDLIAYYTFSKWTRIPITALWPDIAHLVIQKLNAPPGSA